MLKRIPCAWLCLMATTAMAEPPRASDLHFLAGGWLESEGGTGVASPFTSPFGVAVADDGQLFAVELEGGRVWRRSGPAGWRVIAGDGSEGYAGDGGPAIQAVFRGMHNVAWHGDGVLYISDSWNHCVRAIHLSESRIETIAGTGEAGFSGDGGDAKQATFDFVMCVSLTPDGERLLLADLRNRRIRAIHLSDRRVETVAGNGVQGIPENGSVAIDSPLVDPRAVAVDGVGQVYILERSGHALRRVSPNGIIETVAGTGARGYVDGPARAAQFASPKHLSIDAANRVYIADDGNACIRCYDPETETVTTILGRGHGDPKITLSRPHGVCCVADKLLVVDTGHDRILELTLRD